MTLVGSPPSVQPPWLQVVERHAPHDGSPGLDGSRDRATGPALVNGVPKRERAAPQDEVPRPPIGSRPKLENGDVERAHEPSCESRSCDHEQPRAAQPSSLSMSGVDDAQRKYLLVKQNGAEPDGRSSTAGKGAERSAVDSVYEFLATDVNYVLLGDMRNTAGHPSFVSQSRVRPAPKHKSSPEERLLVQNLMRHLDLRELDTPEVEARLVRTFRLLSACGYHWDDIVTVVAHAAIYFPTIRSSVNSQTSGWDHEEVINVLIVLIYLAHAFALDETCPIHHWHRWIFRNYCSLATLNMVVVRVLQLQKFHLCITRKEWRGVSTVLCKGGMKAITQKKEDPPSPPFSQ